MDDEAIAQARELLRKTVEAPRCSPDDSVSEELVRRLEGSVERMENMCRCLAAQQALLDERLVRVERNRLFRAWNAVARRTADWAARVPAPLARLLGRGEDEAAAGRAYSVWVTHEEAGWPTPERARAVALTWRYRPAVSIVMVVENCESAAEALRSVEFQAYPEWEVCVAFDSGSSQRVLRVLSESNARTGRVRYIACDDPDAARRWSAAAGLASGDYIAFLGDRDVLSPLALFSFVQVLQSTAADLVYSDEDELDSNGSRLRPLFKPDWSPELLNHSMYAGKSLLVRTRRFRECGGFRPSVDRPPFQDLALRITAAPGEVRHIGKVLYHSRTPSRPPAPARLSKACPEVTGAVTAIVCSRSPHLLAKCLGSLRSTAAERIRTIIVIAHEESGPNPALRRVIDKYGAIAVPFGGVFNFSLMNNLGAARAETPYLIFLNDDVTAAALSWSEMLVEQLAVRGAGIAGATLWYPSGVLQHAGIVTGLGDGVGHAGRYMRSSPLWPWLLMTREVSAVTGACLAIRADLFRDLGGFDPAFPNNYNDVDLCLRARRLGQRVVCCAAPGLIHAECQTRAGVVHFEERHRLYMTWGRVLAGPDPYYSAALAPAENIALNAHSQAGPRSLLADASGR